MTKHLVQQVAAGPRFGAVLEMRTHLFCGVACSCAVCAGVQGCDEHAAWPGSLTPCVILALSDRCPGTCTCVSTLHRCRTRKSREATHWPASSVFTSGCKTRPLLQPDCTTHNLSKVWIPYCGIPQTFNMWPVLCTTVKQFASSYSLNMAVCSSSLPL